MELIGNIDKPSVLIIARFHGDEPQGEFLIKRYTELFHSSCLLFVPCLNKLDTRVNKNGVDLNRNFPTENWLQSEKNEYFGGDFPASEEETKFIINLVKKYKPKVILTLHSPYKVVNYDGCQDSNDMKIIEKISKIMKYPIEESIGYPTPGSFGTWAGVERRILTITLELDDKVNIEELEKPVFEVFEYLEGIK